MLFFSIAHTLVPMVMAVFLSVPTGLLWLAQTIAALANTAYRAKVGVPLRSLLIFALTLSVHAIALWTYDSWSYRPTLRVAVCSFGLVLTLVALLESWRQLRGATTSTPTVAGEA